MNQNFVKSAVAATLLIAGTIGFSACSSSDEQKSESSAKVEKQTLTNVSYEPARTLKSRSPMAVLASRPWK